MVMSQSDISVLKDTLCAQQQLLQKLYNELDAEREASASAASEALSVILRLHGEKATVKMEAEQYKRLSEEKMCHAEESLEIIEDIIYQKEMEVASLGYQVQAYRHKLLSMGCPDPEIGEIKYSGSLLQRNEALFVGPSIRRRSSAPIFLKNTKFMIEREKSTSPEMIPEEQTDEETNNPVLDSDKKIDNSTSGSINSYCEQIRKLDECVMEITGANFTNFKNVRSSTGNLSDSSNYSKTRSPSPQLDMNLSENGETVDFPRSPNIYDVFEVPQVDQNCRSNESQAKEKKNPEREYAVHPEAVKLYGKDEPDWLKKLLQSNYHGDHLCQPSDISAIDCRFAVVQSSTSGSESRMILNQLNRTSEIIEVERPIEATTNRADEMKLLNEIKEQLNVLQDEITHWKVKKSHVTDEPSLSPLSEAMLYFWL